MRTLIDCCKRFRRDEHGATAIEYCLIAVLVSIVSIGAWTAMGTNLSAMTATVIPGLTR